jgi:hypothetical protein
VCLLCCSFFPDNPAGLCEAERVFRASWQRELFGGNDESDGRGQRGRRAGAGDGAQRGVLGKARVLRRGKRSLTLFCFISFLLISFLLFC